MFCFCHSHSIYFFPSQRGAHVVLIGMAGVALTMMNLEKNSVCWRNHEPIALQFSDSKLYRHLKSLPKGPDGYPLIQAHYLEEAKTIAVLVPFGLTHETNAAALPYDSDLPKNDELTAANFVDMAHATVEVHIVPYQKAQLNILAHLFDSSLAGIDFNEVLFRQFVTKFNAVCKIGYVWKKLKRALSDAGLTVENTMKTVKVARGFGLQCATLTPSFMEHRYLRPLYYNKASFFHLILLLLLHSTQVEAGDNHSQPMSWSNIVIVIFIAAIAAIASIAFVAILCYCIRFCEETHPVVIRSPELATDTIPTPASAPNHCVGETIIQTFPEVPFRAGGDDLDESCFCGDNFTDGEILRGLPNCRHRYHHLCIERWLTTERTYCPYCKYDYKDIMV